MRTYQVTRGQAGVQLHALREGEPAREIRPDSCRAIYQVATFFSYGNLSRNAYQLAAAILYDVGLGRAAEIQTFLEDNVLAFATDFLLEHKGVLEFKITERQVLEWLGPRAGRRSA